MFVLEFPAEYVTWRRALATAWYDEYIAWRRTLALADETEEWESVVDHQVEEL